jgi:hypothetical protein
MDRRSGMHKFAICAGAMLIGLAATALPALSQDPVPGLEAPSVELAPKAGGVAAGAQGAPQPEGKAQSEAENAAPAPGPAGCPLFNRKLDLIV